MRWACVMLLLAGCDTVFKLTAPLDAPQTSGDGDAPRDGDPPSGHDEDGDLIPDEDDLCPHIANSGLDDDDRDGIGDVCDPFRGDAANTRWFIGFHDGVSFSGKALLYNGSFAQAGDDILFGSLVSSPPDLMLLPDPAANALRVREGEIVVEATIVDPVPDSTFHEFGTVFVNTSTNNADRGDICFAGYNGPYPTYLEMVENMTQPGGIHESSQPFRGLRAKLVMTRSTTNVSCALTAPGVTLNGNFQPAIATSGRIGVLTANSRTRFHYVWIVTRP